MHLRIRYEFPVTQCWTRGIQGTRGDTATPLKTDLVLVSVSAPHIKPIMLIRYMWSAMLSGWRTPRFTHPVRFVL
jgi:hypothetical protein